MIGYGKGKLYKINGKVYRLDPELFRLIRANHITAWEIEREYAYMMRATPGMKIVTYNHAAYNAFIKKMRGLL